MPIQLQDLCTYETVVTIKTQRIKKGTKLLHGKNPKQGRKLGDFCPQAPRRVGRVQEYQYVHVVSNPQILSKLIGYSIELIELLKPV